MIEILLMSVKAVHALLEQFFYSLCLSIERRAHQTCMAIAVFFGNA
jgi:hypothetical protein